MPRSPRSITCAWRPPSACSAMVPVRWSTPSARWRTPGRRRPRLRGQGALHHRARVILGRRLPARRRSRTPGHRAAGSRRRPLVAGDGALVAGAQLRAAGAASTTRSTRSPGRRRSRTSCGDRRLASQAAWTRGWIHVTRGDWATGIEAGQRAVALAPDEMSRGLSEGFLGNSYVEKGDPEAALPLLASAAARLQPAGLATARGLVHPAAGPGPAMHGDQAEAATLLARGMEIIRSITFAPARILGHTLQAKLATARGNLDEAQHELRQVAGAGRRHRRGVRGRHHPSGHGQGGPRPQRSARHRAAPPRGARKLHPAESADLGRPRRSPGRAEWRDPTERRREPASLGARPDCRRSSAGFAGAILVLGLGEESEGAVEAPSEVISLRPGASAPRSAPGFPTWRGSAARRLSGSRPVCGGTDR